MDELCQTIDRHFCRDNRDFFGDCNKENLVVQKYFKALILVINKAHCIQRLN